MPHDQGLKLSKVNDEAKEDQETNELSESNLVVRAGVGDLIFNCTCTYYMHDCTLRGFWYTCTYDMIVHWEGSDVHVHITWLYIYKVLSYMYNEVLVYMYIEGFLCTCTVHIEKWRFLWIAIISFLCTCTSRCTN